MSPMKVVIYNLEHYAPNMEIPDEYIKYGYEDYLELLSKLSSDGVNELHNAMISTARHIIDMCEKSNYDYAKEADSVYINGGKKSIAVLSRCHFLRLVERVYSGDNEVNYKLTNTWEIDSDLAKAIFVRSLLKVNLIDSDKDKIQSFYGLVDYGPKVHCDAIDDTDYVKYANTFNKYLYEFYKRSKDPDAAKLKEYEDKTTYSSMSSIYNSCSSDTQFSCSFSVDVSKSVKQTKHDITEYSEDLKFYTKRLYEVNYAEDKYKSSTGGGNSHYSVQFVMWDKCLRVYDMYKKYIDAGKSVERPLLDAIGKNIVNEFKVYKTYKLTELRKEIVKVYKEALRLIEQSVEGDLS